MNQLEDARSEVSSILGFSEVLSTTKALTEKQRRFAANIQTSGRMLLDMINDILDLAKIESGKMDVRAAEFRIDTVIIELCDLMRHLAERKKIEQGFHPPLDHVDAAARICDPIFHGFLTGEHYWGVFLKDYRPVRW